MRRGRPLIPHCLIDAQGEDEENEWEQTGGQKCLWIKNKQLLENLENNFIFCGFTMYIFIYFLFSVVNLLYILLYIDS